MLNQIGGGRCSLCGSPGTNKTTCPLNKKAIKPSPTKHPLAGPRAPAQESDRTARQQAQAQERDRTARQQAQAQERDRTARQRAQAQERDRTARQQAQAQERDRTARQRAQAQERDRTARQRAQAQERDRTARQRAQAQERDRTARQRAQAQERDRTASYKKLTPQIAEDISNSMRRVIELQPGESADCLFYRVYLCDLEIPETLPEGFTLEKLVSASHDICKDRTNGGLSESYIEEAYKESRYMAIALHENGSIVSFVLARQDDVDPRGMYIEALCNSKFINTRITYPDGYNSTKKRVNDEIASLSHDECAARLLALGLTPNDILHFQARFSKKFPHVKFCDLLANRVFNMELQRLGISDPRTASLSLRNAQLLQLLIFNYANKLGIRHIYNSASAASVAVFHSRNGMTLRTTNCGQPDEIADEFEKVPLDDRQQYIELKKIAKDKTGSYPMKLCDYNIKALFTELESHMLTKIDSILDMGFTMEDIILAEVL